MYRPLVITSLSLELVLDFVDGYPIRPSIFHSVYHTMAVSLRQIAIAGVLSLSLFLVFYARVNVSKTAQKADSRIAWKMLSEGVAVWDIGQLPTVIMDLENTVNYQVNSTPSTNAQWAALYPHEGIVRLGSDSKPFLPSMFHQLRCLDIIRLAYVAQEENLTFHDESASWKARDEHYHDHSDAPDVPGVVEDPLARHCLNYLREMLLCRSDLNLESVQAMGPGDPNIHAVSFRRAQTCQDWTVVYDKLSELSEEMG
ncbi:hypothetical protein D9758_006800 [Tetrapyrgos nigripes]|uniref:Uncharacterized protein n=1 Tax=Tetrapyrgos nigripes TaxID=182062 RepID=A0A8H5CVE1_9AGAR|nr:hypothetical protein D9758_006800 [Tetrapyrgos nigripes]